jgi:hypothetical protein
MVSFRSAIHLQNVPVISDGFFARLSQLYFIWPAHNSLEGGAG